MDQEKKKQAKDLGHLSAMVKLGLRCWAFLSDHFYIRIILIFSNLIFEIFYAMVLKT